MLRRTVRKKKKLSVEEKIKSNQVKILEDLPDGNQMSSAALEMGAAGGRQTPFSKLKFVLLLACHLASIARAGASSLSDFDGATFYKAPLGSRIRIACNASHWNDDSISLVLWFKGNPTGAAGQLQPIYTIDARQKPLSSGQARHLIGDSLKGRARFVFPNVTSSGQQHQPQQQQQQPLVPYLDLAPLEAEDQAEYRCRVDYRSRPRENFLVVLFVLVPPSSVEVVDANGRQVEQIYGPLNEGSELKLVCLSRGGRPPPAVVWKRAGRLIDESYLTLNDFLTLKLANGSHQQRHSSHQHQNQQPPERGDNNLTLTPGQWPLANQTGAADWLNWPEFNYFRQLLRADQSLVRGRSQQLESSGGGGGGGQHAQLIDLQVDQTAATAVNVLHLNELTRAHLLGGWPEEAASVGGQLEPAARPVSPSPLEANKLECHASNEHYDLHTLIKLFAPASLVESRSLQQQPQPQVDSAYRNSPSGGALTQATERAIWASLNASTATLVSGSGRQHESLPLTIKQRLQQPPEDAPAPGQNQTTQAANWPLVIEQQLIRPHQQLVEAASKWATEWGDGGNASQKSARPPTSSLPIRSALIALEANLRPLDVRILQPSRPLVAGQVHEFTCQSGGSRPAARLTWLKDGQRLESGASEAGRSDERERERGHNKPEPYKLLGSASSLISESRLTMRIRREDQNARLTCQAENEHFKRAEPANNLNERDWRLEDTLTLNVHYAPQVRLELGNKMLSETVREGQDIYFVCQCDSNPAVNEITWLHDERPINETLPAGSDQTPRSPAPNELSQAANLIVSNDSLVLQRVQLERAGQYACLASNSEGVGLSNQIELRVLHAPICVTRGEEEHRNGRQPALNQIDNQLALSLGPFKQRASAWKWAQTGAKALKLTCQMLVPELDDEQLEISWWSNGTGGERRLLARQTSRELKLIDVRQSDLLGWPGRNVRAAGGAANQAGKMTSRRVRLAVAHLELNWTSGGGGGGGGDSGRAASGEHVFCLARNSLGDQKRSCHYAIEPQSGAEDSGGPRSVGPAGQRAGQHLACLPLNVTANSAWIGCDSHGARLVAGGQLDEDEHDHEHEHDHDHDHYDEHGDELNRVEENNDRLRAPALNQVVGGGDQRNQQAGAPTSLATNKTNESQIGHAKLAFQFNVLVFSLAQSQSKHEVNKQLEANLSSGRLSEPLFAVANLRANADYLLEIEDQSGRISSPNAEHTDYKLATSTTTTSLRTSPPEGPVEGQSQAHHETAARPKPSIRQVTEPHPADLLESALISTRSIAADRSGRPSSMRQRQASESIWSTLWAQLMGWTRAEPVGAARRPWRAEGRSAGGYLTGVWSSSPDDWASPLVLCILTLMLLLVALVGLTAIRKSRLWSGQPIPANGHQIHSSSPYGSPRLGRLKRATSSELANEQVGLDQDDEHEAEGERKRSRSATSSAVSSSSSPPSSAADKRNRELEMAPLSEKSQKLATAPCGAGRTLQNHHYSTLDSHNMAQHLAGGALEQPASLNFLKSSSIATMRRGHLVRGQRQPVATIQQVAQISPASAVTRSRSSLGFGGLGAGESSLMLMAHFQQTAPSPAPTARQRLIQSNEVILNGNGRQSAEWLISDANFGLATTSHTTATAAAAAATASTTGYTLTAPGDVHDPDQNQTMAAAAEFQRQWPYMERVSERNQAKLASGGGVLEIGLESQTDLYALGAARLVGELSPSSGCCADESNDNHHVCQCQATIRRDLIVCCPPEDQQVDQQQCASFIELVPGCARDARRDQIPFASGAGRYAHQLDLQAYELQMAAVAPPLIGQHNTQAGHQVDNKNCHQPLFNQSLNSSSIGSPSTHNQLGSSPLGSLTNTTPPNSNTESSYQTNNMATATGRLEESSLNKTNRRLTSILKNHSNQPASDSDDAPFQSANRPHQATKVPRSSNQSRRT